MSAARAIPFFCLITLGGCAWHYPMPVYPPFPPDHGYSAPYDPNQPLAQPLTDGAILQQPAPPLTGS